METEQRIKPKSAFRKVNDLGVVWVTDEATKLGYYNGNPDWINLGQGEPETGEMKGAPPRIKHAIVALFKDSFTGGKGDFFQQLGDLGQQFVRRFGEEIDRAQSAFLFQA